MFKLKNYIQKAKAQFMEGYKQGRAKARSANDELANLQFISKYPVYNDAALLQRLRTFVLMYPRAGMELTDEINKSGEVGAAMLQLIPHQTFVFIQMHLHQGNMKTAEELLGEYLRENGHEDLLSFRAASMKRLDEIIRQRDPGLADDFFRFNNTDRNGGDA